MKYEDTVMNEDQKDWYSLAPDGVGRHQYAEPFLTDILTAQAEISFKAGVKEVVDWVKQQPKIGTGVFIVGIEHEQIYGWKVLFPELQAKLKDWGIDG